jgi:hypothetical protein
MLEKGFDPKQLSAYLFWDIAISSLDPDLHASYIIDRVLSLGTLEDFRKIKSYYGSEKISSILKELRYLDDKVLHFSSVYFNIPLSEFRCYTQRQLTPPHWQY